MLRERSLLPGLFLFDREYLQVELGEDKIDDDPEHIFEVQYRHPIYGKLLYAFNPVKKDSTVALPTQLYIKLPTNLKSLYHKCLPYRFELFKPATLVYWSANWNFYLFILFKSTDVCVYAND